MKTKLFTLFFALMASINLWAIGRNDGSTMANAIDYDWDNGLQQSSGTKWYYLDLAPLYDSTDTLRFHITNLSNTESVDVSCRIMIMGETDSFEQTLAPQSTYDTWEIFYEPLVRSHQIELYFVVSSSGTVNLFWQRLSKSGDSCEEAKRGGCQEAGTKWHILESPDMEEREYIDSLVIHFENTDANYNYNDISNTISVSFKTDCESPEFYSQTFTIEPYDENTIAFSAVMLASLGWPDLVFTCTSSTSCRIIYGYHGDFPHEPSGEWCGDALNLAWEPVEQQANMDRWYRFQTSEESDNPIYGSFSPIIPDTCDLRIKISNISDENANVFADVYVECSEPALKAESYILQPFASDSFDIDRDMLERFGWPPMIYNVTSNQNISIQAELIPDMPRDTLRDTIVAYVCQGDMFEDTIPYNWKIIDMVDHSMTWKDTVEFRDGLQMKDSIITFYIHPLIMPEPLSAEEMRGVGAAPLLVQGMQLYVDESNAALTEYYRNLGNTVDTIAHIDTAYWAKPVYYADGSLDVKKEAPLDLSKYYSKNEYMDTLLLVVKSEECDFIMRIEYIFPIEGIHYSSIADLYNMAADSTFTLGAFDVVYVPDFQNGSNMYIKDETGSMVIYKPNYGLQAGDHVEAGLQGKISIYHGLYEVAPVSAKEDLTVTAGDAPAPMVATEVPSATNVNQFVVYKNVSFATDTAFVESKRHAVHGTWNNQQITFYNQYYIGAMLSANKTYNITAVNTIYGTTPQAYPLAVEEVTTDTIEPCHTISGTCGTNLTWELSCDSVLTISGTGAMWNYLNPPDEPWYSYRSSITSLVIEDNVTSISWNFRRLTGLTSVVIGNSITNIESGAFEGCTGLSFLTIGNHVTSIGTAAFSQCLGLTSIEIPNSVTSIGNHAFWNCFYVTSPVYIHNNVTNIGADAFGACSIPSFEVNSDNSNYCAVDGVLFDKTKHTLIQYPGGNPRTEYTIPETVTSIEYGAFDGAELLTSITIGNNVTSIGNEAFSFCMGLTSIEIPNSVTSIERFTFSYCSNLTSVVLPNSIVNINDGAFAYCRNLTSFTNYATTPQTLKDEYVFSDVNLSNCTLYVPAQSIAAYQTADVWKEFGNILPIEEPIVEPTDSVYEVVYLDQAGLQLDAEPIILHLPVAPVIEGFSFLKWQVVAGDLENGIYIQAVYTANEPTNAPEVYTNPANKAQKLIRNGKVYILTDDKVYSISGQKVK